MSQVDIGIKNPVFSFKATPKTLQTSLHHNYLLSQKSNSYMLHQKMSDLQACLSLRWSLMTFKPKSRQLYQLLNDGVYFIFCHKWTLAWKTLFLVLRQHQRRWPACTIIICCLKSLIATIIACWVISQAFVVIYWLFQKIFSETRMSKQLTDPFPLHLQIYYSLYLYRFHRGLSQ